MSDLGKNLRKLRKERGITQEKLAAVLHYGYTAITNYESGRNEPCLDDLIRIADYFDVSLDTLLGRERPNGRRYHGIWYFIFEED